VQCGYDQALVTQGLAPAAAFLNTVPRDSDGFKLQVLLPGVVPGNVLEVDYSLYILNQNLGGEPIFFATVVSFVDSPVFPADYAIVSSATAGMSPPAVGSPYLYRSLSAVVIPPGAVNATVRVAYNDAALGAFLVYGADGVITASTLKASELSAGVVSQPGESTLIPYP
jgi:hypothetical protein